jgi:glycosyltransferase involved in cell wall biosynthesis
VIVPTLRVCIDARARHAVVGGIQQFVIGLVSGLSGLADGDEEYVVLGDGTQGWLRGHVGGRCRVEDVVSVATRTDAVTLKEALLRAAPAVTNAIADLPILCGVALPAIPRSSGALERLRPDVVHFTAQDAFLTSVPSIYHPHDLQHLHLPQLFGRRVRHVRERNYRAFCAQAAMVAVSSSWTRDDVVQRYGLAPEKVRVVPLAPPTETYPPPTAEAADAFLAERGLPPRFVFYPAQTWPHKNHALLLEALARLRRDGGLVVPLVSSGHRNAWHERLRARAAALGISDQVHFVGFVSPAELQCLYARSAAVIIPSLFEAASFPLWEAFLAGVPAACSNVTSLPAQAGDAAIVFDPRDVAQIAEAVARLWTDAALGAELVRRGRASVARFSWDRTARLFRAHYRRLAGRALGAEDAALLSAPALL